jgi:hypothetical protein
MTSTNQMSYFESLVKFHAENNHTIKMGNELFEDVATLKYSGTL